MDKDVIPLLCCPDSGGELELKTEQEEDNRILAGELVSIETGHSFPIKDGIARMLPAREEGPPRSEAIPNGPAWEARVHQFERGLLSRIFTPFETSAFRYGVDLSGEDWLIELGCGRGRLSVHFTGIPHRHVCVDTSVNNLLVCKDRVEQRGFRYTSWVQADPVHLPFNTDSFDKLFSAQMIQHILKVEHRTQSLQEMARVCRPTGRLVVSAYSYDLFALLRRDKSGKHRGGLGYLRFSKEEFISLLHAGMLVEEVNQKLQYVWVGHGVPIKEFSMVIS
ncbi:MAG: methyltransferase domain-containing protein [Armatimonadetes bacterium]|nr:methyltransferase domain-containing protein [Armatimonadota bacterium]